MGGRDPLRPDEFETVVDGTAVGPAVSDSNVPPNKSTDRDQETIAFPASSRISMGRHCCHREPFSGNATKFFKYSVAGAWVLYIKRRIEK